ncbi:copper ion binding protein [bacterium]|nr:copper ion binding protein [bacterium]
MSKTEETLRVSGMSCQHCVNAIEKGLRELDGVKEVKVDLKAKEVEILYDETGADLGKIKAKIEELGYKPEGGE